MNIVFMGTPDFAVPSLVALKEEGHVISAVYSQPDKPKGRGHKLMPTPVKECALKLGLEVRQPSTLKDEAILNEIAKLNPDCIVVVAYGKIIPLPLLNIPKNGCINVHGSLLPMYRGAAPIQWSIINGDKITGITTMLMNQGIDTGDILLKLETEIGQNETSGELFDRLKLLGAQVLVKTLEVLPDITPTKQSDENASLAPMISKDMSEINWSLPADKIHNLIRGLNPWPSAVAVINGARLKIHKSEVIDLNGEPGTAVANHGELCVYCGKGAVLLKEIQPENGKRMSGSSYLLGHPLK